MSVTAPLIAETVLITWRSASRTKAGTGLANKPISALPLPSEYVGALIIYGALSLATGELERPATILGWGLVVATLMNFWDPSTIGTNKAPAVKTTPQPTVKA